jgi:enoyl-CoA hydratase
MEQGAGVSLPTGCTLEARAFALLFASADAREGMRAFVEKRPAYFKGQ